MPRDNAHEVGHKAGNIAPQEGAIAHDGISFVGNIDLKLGEHDCKQRAESRFTRWGSEKGAPVAILPTGHGDKVCQMAGHAALEEDIICRYHILLTHMSCITLGDNCESKNCEWR